MPRARVSSASKDWCRLDRPRWGGGASYVRIHRGPPGAMVAARPPGTPTSRSPRGGSKDSLHLGSPVWKPPYFCKFTFRLTLTLTLIPHSLGVLRPPWLYRRRRRTIKPERTTKPRS